jgi:hypothetical protein
VKSFEVPNGTPIEFVERVRRELSDSLKNHVELTGDDTRIAVRFRWMGTTELVYRIEPAGEGFRAILDSERVSPMHLAFRSSFDERLDSVLEKLGARTV